MFGRLRPDFGKVDRQDVVEYQRTYCNLCGTLSSEYGTASRWLTVYDLASLAWLFGTDEATQRPRSRLNCVRGGRRPLRPVDRFLAAISAVACGVKVDDDLADEQSIRGRLAKRSFRWAFDESRVVLAGTGFEVDLLAELLDRQRCLEARWETDLERSSEPTGRTFALIARQLIRLSDSPLDEGLAEDVGDVLGRSVFLVDAHCDAAADARRGSYNPLNDRGSRERNPTVEREAALRNYLLGELRSIDARIAGECPALSSRWIALRDPVLRRTGILDPSVVLNFCCVVPFGDGHVGVDGKDFDELFKFCGIGCCLAVFCCSRGGC